MGSHPVNLALRFLLEIAALIALGYWGWKQGTGTMRYVAAVGIPVVAAVLWATLRFRGDPQRAPIAVPGIARLTLEAVFFGGAVLALSRAGARLPAWILGILVITHYVASYDRVGLLLRR
jgi:hypothetical protein